MADYSDDFARADEAIEAGSWIALDGADDNSNVARVSASRMVSNSTSQRVVAWYTGTVPTGVPQENGAAVTSSGQGTNHYIDVGVMGKSGTSGFTSLPLGLWARLTYLANGARRISLLRFLPSDSAEATITDIDLVSAGGIEVAGYEGVLVKSGAVGVLQLVRIVAKASSPHGIRVQVFLNTRDDDRPVIDWLVDRDMQGTGDSNQTYGRWWVGFGPSADSALSIAGVLGSDYVDDEGKVEDVLRQDQPTLLEIMTRVRGRYERSARGSLTDAAVQDAVIDGLRRIRDRAGLNQKWLERIATISLTVNTATSECTLPDDIDVPIRIMHASDNTPVHFKRLARTTSGALVIQLFALNGSFRVVYRMRYVEPSALDQRCPIPKQHDHVLVSAACMRLAMDEGRPEMMQIFAADFESGLDGLLRWQAHDHNMDRAVMQTVRHQMPYHRN